MSDNFVIKQAQVESVTDDTDGMRIKARLAQDGDIPTSELPYAFPLLPKTFQTVPKVGEGVFIICDSLNSVKGNRYYIGPIISQPQYNEKDNYSYGRGTATSLLQGGILEPLSKLSNYAETYGSFPTADSVAVIGRSSEDIEMKNDSINIRCGIRQDPTIPDKNLKGKVVFNTLDPTYLKLKYKKNLTSGRGKEANSIATLVADKINLVSNKDINGFKLTDTNDMISDSEYQRLMDNLHQLPYGDRLVEYLTMLRQAFVTHVHPYPLLPPCNANLIPEINSYNLDDILSEHVRIS